MVVKAFDRRVMVGAISACLIVRTGGHGRALARKPGVLLGRLRKGGLVIFFRHSLTVREGQPDDDLTNCVNQRNLTESGRALATDIGLAFRALAIPVGDVLTSPYCRCVDTARLAFGRATVTPYLETNGDADSAGEQARLRALADAIQTAPAAGLNTIMCAHGNNLGGLARWHGYPPLPVAEAEAVIFAPLTGRVAEPLRRVEGPDWRGLAEES